LSPLDPLPVLKDFEIEPGNDADGQAQLLAELGYRTAMVFVVDVGVAQESDGFEGIDAIRASGAAEALDFGGLITSAQA
jgi:hypothetical protein